MKKKAAFLHIFLLISSFFLPIAFAGTSSELDGDWKIRAYVSPSDELLFDGEINFENSKFLIQGDYLVQMPWEDQFLPKPVSQAGTFSIQDNKIAISNYDSIEGAWTFGGDYKLLLFADRDESLKSIKKLPSNTHYFFLENKNKPVCALFITED